MRRGTPLFQALLDAGPAPPGTVVWACHCMAGTPHFKSVLSALLVAQCDVSDQRRSTSSPAVFLPEQVSPLLSLRRLSDSLRLQGMICHMLLVFFRIMRHEGTCCLLGLLCGVCGLERVCSLSFRDSAGSFQAGLWSSLQQGRGDPVPALPGCWLTGSLSFLFSKIAEPWETGLGVVSREGPLSSGCPSLPSWSGHLSLALWLLFFSLWCAVCSLWFRAVVLPSPSWSCSLPGLSACWCMLLLCAFLPLTHSFV